MLQQCIEGLNIKPNGIYVDVTYGGGGHASAILEQLDEGKLLAFDQDPDAAKGAQDSEKLIFINHNFQYLTNFLKYYDIQKVDGILADLGISSHQIDEGERGFSFRYDATLDMRMGQTGNLTAEEIINTYDVEALSALFRNYGEIKFGWKLAQKIVAMRQTKRISTTGELADIVAEFSPKHARNKELAQVFQAIRIEVNDEMSSLRNFLTQSIAALAEGGRLVVMSYHSLEDRMVKNFMTYGNESGSTDSDAFGNIASSMRPVQRKAITADAEELSHNPRSRSAKLRIAEKV